MSHEIQNIFVEAAWYLTIAGFGIILATKLFANTKITWALVGVLLLIIAIGNAVILIGAGLNPSQTTAAIISLAIHGSLGVRFIGNWLTDGAT